MPTFLHLVRSAAIALTLSLLSGPIAFAATIHFKADFDLRFDCERPFFVRNHPIHAEFTALLNSDKSATADLSISGICSF
jgi:hypothetical protein